MKTLAEYGLVGCGALFFAAAILQFGWYWSESYPRSLPTLLSIPGCVVAMFYCFSKAAELSVSRWL